MGRNGMGKTTLLKCIMGLLPVTSGQILFAGRDLRPLKAEARAPLRIGYVPQGREIFSQLTVEENLRIGLAVRRPKTQQIPEHLSAMFPVLKQMLRRRGGDLSGGQQQQLAIARALVLDPELLILDEPTEGIQPNIVHDIGDVIQRLNREINLTVLLVEQKLPFARRVASDLRILDKGRLVVSGRDRGSHGRPGAYPSDCMNALPAALPAEGWRARLELRFEARDRRTCLTHRAHRGPLLVQRAFYPERATDRAASSAQPCHVYLIHPPGGVVSGDDLSLDVEVGPDAHALLTTPAAGKFYRRRQQSVARLTQMLRVNDGLLEWLPQENIYYPDCAADLTTIVRLHGDARVIGWEIACLGLPASHATLGEGRVRQCFELWLEDSPLWLERLTLDRACLQARWGLAGHVALGTLLAFPASEQHLERSRALARQWDVQGGELTLACTLVDKTLCCRGYAARADRLKQCFIDLWSALRFELLGRTATAPRIWMT